MSKNYEIAPDGKGGWNVRKWGSKRSAANFDTKDKAIVRGRELTKKSKGELSVKNLDGKIGKKWSYGNDPRNIKG